MLRTVRPRSFTEDPLRLVRGLRLVSQLGLEPDEDTLRQMREAAPSIQLVSAERIGGDAPQYAIQIKGTGMKMHDWRGAWGTLLGQCISGAGPCWQAPGVDAYAPEPDLGYPEFATRWAKRQQWTDNTICHNTVIINGLPQSTNWVGHPEFFAQLPDFGGFSVGSPEVYGDLAKIYNRTMALVKAAPGKVGQQGAYALDVFRVRAAGTI